MRRTSLGSVPVPVSLGGRGGRYRLRWWVLGLALLVAVAAPAPADSGRTHRVAAGETLYRIAKNYGITVDLLRDANAITDPTRLRVGQELVIPRAHVVRPGDTVYALSRRFQVEVAEILRANGITDPTSMEIGELLVIPGGNGEAARRPEAADTVARAAPAASTRPVSDENRLWPLHGPRRRLTGKLTGIVIAGQEGAAVRSVSSGTVRWASPSRGFGHVVLVQNPLGYIFGYLGNSETLVDVGDRVEIGTEIGRLGINPHDDQPSLYFVVFKDGRPADPSLAPRV